jgi:hypothetical protein
LAWEPATARGPSRVADPTPRRGCGVKEYRWSTGRKDLRGPDHPWSPTSNEERLAAAGAFPLYPFIYFPFAVPARPRERTERTGRQMGAKKRGAAGGRGAGAKKGRPAKQMKLTDSTDGFLPEIKDPKSVIGVQIEIPGSFWSEFCKSLSAT